MRKQYITLSCEQCGKSFTVPPSESSRQFCSRKCLYKSREVTEKRICPICQKEYEVRPSQRNVYCSPECSVKAKYKVRPILTCKQCEQTFEVLPARAKETPQFCSIQCRGAWMSKYHKFTCKQCGKQFSVPTWRVKDNPTWCSNHCRNDWNKAQGKTPRIKICPCCGKEFTERSTDIRHYCSYECAYNARKVTVQCEVCGRLKEIAHNKLKRFRFCSAECKWVWITKNMPRISSIEIKMAEAFEQIGLNPESQYIIGPFVADFAFPDHKLVVECDGDYWHNLPHIQKKDKIKNYYYWKTGWRIVRLWEHEINASSIECAIRVQSHLHDLTSS